MALSKITTASITDNAVTSDKVSDTTIATADIADGGITTAKLADNAVTTAKITNDAVTTAKVNPSQTDITSVGALNAGSITSGFGSIDVGSSNITTTGGASFGNINATTVANISFNSHGTYLGNYRSIGWGGTANGTTQIYSQYNTIDHLVLHAGTGKNIIFETGGSTADRMTLDSNGDLTIGNGNLVIGTSGKGIDFSTGAGGGSTSNLLDEYEEGTFTFGSNSNVGFVSNSNVGKYTKIGRVVHLQYHIDLSSVSSTNHFYMSSMPFAGSAHTSNTLNGGSTGTVMLYNVNTHNSGYQFNSYIGNNSSNMYFYESIDNANWSIVTNGAMVNSSELIISHTYVTDA